jgi:PAP2 superfamily
VPASVPFVVAQPSFCVCGVCTVVFALRYALTENARDLRLAGCAFLALAGGILCMSAADAEGRWISARYDLFVYAWDRGMGWGEPAFRLGRLLGSTWGLWTLSFAYGLLGIAVAAILMAYAWKPLPEAREVMAAVLVNFLLAPLFYAAFPVSGPRFAFASFPAMPGVVIPHVLHFHAAPNGVPSVHCSTALLVWWYSRRWRVGSFAAGAHLALVIVSTLASGQHYLFDLLVAVPYAAGAVLLGRLFRPEQATLKMNEPSALTETVARGPMAG